VKLLSVCVELVYECGIIKSDVCDFSGIHPKLLVHKYILMQTLDAGIWLELKLGHTISLKVG